jgi:hypothetical protein
MHKRKCKLYYRQQCDKEQYELREVYFLCNFSQCPAAFLHNVETMRDTSRFVFSVVFAVPLQILPPLFPGWCPSKRMRKIDDNENRTFGRKYSWILLTFHREGWYAE